MSVLGLLEMAAKMAAMERDIEAATQRVIEEAARYVYHEARALIGTYTAGWRQLGPAAIARHGDTPLLDTGKLRASIGVKIGRHVADVGTNDPVIAYQEFGTPRIPPRPVFGFIAPGVEVVIKQATDRYMPSALAGRGSSMHGLHEFKHILHKFKEMYHDIKELGEQVLSDEEGGHR